MSLIPYHPHEGREIVLRHRNAIVVRDTASQRLEIRGLPECPTCHQPLNRASANSPFERPFETTRESYVDPDYFRMLQAGHAQATPQRPPPSPIRRIIQPALAGSLREQSAPPNSTGLNEDVEFVSSTPGVAQADGSRIRREAFSPNYFSTFFVEEKVLGKGGKGVVLLVRHEIDGCHLGHFACKRVPVGDDHAWLEKVLIEVELLAKLSHPNLVSYRHVWLEDVRLTRFGPSVACAFILQQYCNGGDLHQYIVGNAPQETSKEELKARMRRRSKGQAENPAKPLSGKGSLSFEEIYSLFKDVTSGVSYLHAANYIHRDLKPSNCLLHREGGNLTCLISDFGEVQAENVVRKSTGTTGTISYCAPEVLKMDAAGRYGNFTTKSDIFSLGMILYFMCFGRLPYHSANALQEELEDIDALRAEITDWRGFHDERRERPDLPSKLYTLLKKLLALDPSERPSAAEVLSAMRNETSFESFARDHSNAPSIDMRGSRVQNLDSPATPGTPIADSRRSHPRPRLDSSSESAWGTSPLAHETSPGPSAHPEDGSFSGEHDATVVALARSQSVFRAHSMSPEPSSPAKTDIEVPQDFAPRLLLPPPRNGFTALQYRIAVATNFLGLDLAQANYLARMSLFLVKMVALARPCWPYMVNIEVSAPLVVVAALDLGLPSSTGLPLARHHYQERIGLRMTRAWGLGTSVTLLLLHLVVVWLARRWEALCVTATHHESWDDWQPQSIDHSI